MQTLRSIFIILLLTFCGRSIQAEAVYALDARQLSAKERGQLIGQSLKNDIQERLSVWNALLQEHLGSTGKDLLSSLEESTSWQGTIELHAPALLEEVEAMAMAAEVDYHQLLSYNLAEEIMTIHSDSYQTCTGFAAFLPDTAALAYNLDIPEFLHGKKRPYVLLTDTKQYILGFPGIIATTVITPDFTVTTNSLPDLNSDGKGLPLPFALRLMSEQDSIEDAIHLIEDLDLAVAQNFLLISKGSIVNIEKSASTTEVHRTSSQDAFFFHTNFALFNTDVIKKNVSPVRESAPVCERFQSLSLFTQHQLKLNNTRQLLQGIKATVDNETFFTLSVAYACGESQIQLFLPQSSERNTFPF